MSAIYRAETTGDVALVAATAKTILNVINGANALFRITELGVSFESVVAADEPVEVELMTSTQAGAGTSSAVTILQIHGPTRTVQATARHTYTAEPTALTNWKRWLVHPQTGIVLQSICYTSKTTLNSRYLEREEY